MPAEAERGRDGQLLTRVKTITSIHFRSFTLVAFSMSRVMDLTAALKTLRHLTYSADVSGTDVKTIFLLNLCLCCSHSPSTSVCFLVAVHVSYSDTYTARFQESTAAPMTQTAPQYKLYRSVTLGMLPYGIHFMAPNILM